MAHQIRPRRGPRHATGVLMEPRRPMREPSYHWPSGPTADDDPTPLESALAALRFGAILAAAATIGFLYLGEYFRLKSDRWLVSAVVLAAFLAPSVLAWLRTAWVRRRRPPGSG